MEKYAVALNIEFSLALIKHNFKGLGMCSKSRMGGGGLCFSLPDKQLLKSSLNERK